MNQYYGRKLSAQNKIEDPRQQIFRLTQYINLLLPSLSGSSFLFDMLLVYINNLLHLFIAAHEDA